MLSVCCYLFCCCLLCLLFWLCLLFCFQIMKTCFACKSRACWCIAGSKIVLFQTYVFVVVFVVALFFFEKKKTKLDVFFYVCCLSSFLKTQDWIVCLFGSCCLVPFCLFLVWSKSQTRQNSPKPKTQKKNNQNVLFSQRSCAHK